MYEKIEWYQPWIMFFFIAAVLVDLSLCFFLFLGYGLHDRSQWSVEKGIGSKALGRQKQPTANQREKFMISYIKYCLCLINSNLSTYAGQLWAFRCKATCVSLTLPYEKSTSTKRVLL